MPRTSIQVEGKILYLTEDPDLLRRQLAGEDVEIDVGATELVHNISTDELTPGWVCYYYDETLARYCLVGLRGVANERDAIKKGGFGVIVSVRSKGCGSSRETAPYSELEAGVSVVVARSIEKIYGQNAQTIGLLTTTDFSMLERLARGDELPIAEFTKGLDPISRDVVEYGGLFNYNKARLAGEVAAPELATPAPTHASAQPTAVDPTSTADLRSDPSLAVGQGSTPPSTTSRPIGAGLSTTVTRSGNDPNPEEMQDRAPHSADTPAAGTPGASAGVDGRPGNWCSRQATICFNVKGLVM